MMRHTYRPTNLQSRTTCTHKHPVQGLGLLFAAIVFFLLPAIALPDDDSPAPYEEYLQDIPATPNASSPAGPATWTGDGSDASTQRYQQPDAQPLPGLDQATPEVPVEAIQERSSEIVDETTFLSSHNEPEDEPKPLDRRHIITIALIALGFGLIGGLIGVGVEIIRIKRGKKRHRRRPPRLPKLPSPPRAR